MCNWDQTQYFKPIYRLGNSERIIHANSGGFIICIRSLGGDVGSIFCPSFAPLHQYWLNVGRLHRVFCSIRIHRSEIPPLIRRRDNVVLMIYKSQPFNRKIIQLQCSPTWSCVSLTRSTTSSEWKLFTLDKMKMNYFQILLMDVT